MVARAYLPATCEHGGNRVPKEYRALFAGHKSLRATHRAYDLGCARASEGLAGERQWRMLREVLVESVGDIVYGDAR